MTTKTPMTKLLNYIKSSTSLTFLPEQLTSLIEETYLPLEAATIRDAFDEGESNVWNSKRDEGFTYEGGTDYFKQTFNQ
jgi:hypothetical protein